MIKVKEGDEFPCDMVLLVSSDGNGKANLKTANLDGETNLKQRRSPVQQKLDLSEESLVEFGGRIRCENPNANLNNFVGKIMSRPGESAPLNNDNVMLRGTTLANTDWVYGVAVYTGADSKMSMNAKITRNKFSTVEKTMNKYLVFFLILLLLEVALATTLKYTVAFDSPGKEEADLPWYWPIKVEVKARQMAQDILSFMVLFNYIIPISLYVTLEVQKFCGSMFFAWDIHMYDEETNEPAKCNSSDLNEELGQVHILKSLKRKGIY